MKEKERNYDFCQLDPVRISGKDNGLMQVRKQKAIVHTQWIQQLVVLKCLIRKHGMQSVAIADVLL